MWITNGTQADWVCLLVNTSDGPAHRNKSLICVPLKQGGKRTPGVTANPIEKIGMWSSDTAQLFFDEVRVPQRFRIGEEGMGFTYQMMQFQEERLSAAARRITALTQVIEQTIDYTRQRIAFGKPILDNQVVHFRLAELKTEIELLRSLVYRATDVHMAGEDMTELASMAKLKVVRVTARGTVELRCKPGGTDTARVCWLSIAQGDAHHDAVGLAEKLAAMLRVNPWLPAVSASALAILA
jgi:citronellyl-CoA dehydrogenase